MTMVDDRPSTATTRTGGSRGQRRTARRRRMRSAVPLAYLAPTILLMLGLMAVPVGLVLMYSFVNRAIINPDSSFVGLRNYIEVLTDPDFMNALGNTAVFSLLSVLGHFLLGMTFALLLNSDAIGGATKTAFRALYILPWLFTAAVVAVLWRMLLNPNGIVNFLIGLTGDGPAQIEWLADPDLALPTVTFINIWAGYPFFMVTLLAGLQGVSKDLYEAARIDRAGPVKQFFHVTLPHLRPIIISMALLDFIWTSQHFAIIWLTTGGGPIDATEMVSTYTYKLAFSSYDFAVASASAVIVLLLSMVMAFLYVRHQRARD